MWEFRSKLEEVLLHLLYPFHPRWVPRMQPNLLEVFVFMDDYDLWKLWWYACLYGASAEKRMQLIDSQRKYQSEEA
jgi:hypothetical protein